MATNSPVYPTAPVAPRRVSPLDRLQGWLPKLVLAPSVVVVLFCMYGYIGWTLLLSFTNSRFMPSYKWAGLSQYQRLWDNDRWWVASKNLLLFGGSFIAICLVLGVFLAVLLDQRIRREGFIRTLYLYPMALSMIVTGTAWKWLLNPGLGLDKLLRDWGWEGFRFDWLVDPERVVYCLVIAAVWQASGFVMALFLAGLRGVDPAIVRAAQEEALRAIRPGVTGQQVDRVARDFINRAGYEGCFEHGLGHSIGLDGHENPRFNQVCTDLMQPGIVMTVEPGIYLENRFGVRIEDMGVITEDGFEDFTHCSKDLIVL